MTAPDPIATFEGGVVRVKTMADGSPRFEFEAGEDAITQMQRLAEAQANRRFLMVMVFDADEWKEFEADSR
jgi:hypothetical protein